MSAQLSIQPKVQMLRLNCKEGRSGESLRKTAMRGQKAVYGFFFVQQHLFLSNTFFEKSQVIFPENVSNRQESVQYRRTRRSESILRQRESSYDERRV